MKNRIQTPFIHSHGAAVLLVLCIEMPAHVIYKTIVNDGKKEIFKNSIKHLDQTCSFSTVLEKPALKAAEECNNNIKANGEPVMDPAKQSITTKV